MKRKSYLIGFAVLLLFGACDNDVAVKEVNGIPIVEKISFSETEGVANHSLNEFGVSFFDAAVSEFSESDNVVVSPLSASLCVAMLANSADQEMEDAIMRVLGKPSLSVLNTTCNQLMRYLPSDVNGGELLLANSCWVAEGYDPLAAWKESMKKTYYADVYSIDFSKEQEIERINKWCDEKTNGLIPEVDFVFPENTVISLINALYFNGKWDKKFNKDLTDVQPFYGRDRETKAGMMHMTGTLAVSKDDDFTAVELPMGNNRMRLYLPEEGVKVSDLVSRLSYAKIDNLSWEKANVELALPKFRADNSFEVSDIFHKLGLPTTCGLDKLGLYGDMPLAINQQTYTSIDEEGAKAAAVTTTGFATSTGGEFLEKVVLRFDRPFMYAIENSTTGTIIMMGVINNL